MTIDAQVLSSKTVDLLCAMYAAEYASASAAGRRYQVASMLNAIGACAGFAAQTAVWRELIMPSNRNPGDFLLHMTTKSGDQFILGESVNQFLLGAPDRLSFLPLVSAALENASELLNVGELLGHVASTAGSEAFGKPRLPTSVNLIELPRDALTRTWAKAARILEGARPGEWPSLLGAAAYNIVTANRKLLPARDAVKVLLEAAVPMSKIDPATVAQSGVPLPPPPGSWSMRARDFFLQKPDPGSKNEILAEIRSAMPATPANIEAKPRVISDPVLAFVNLDGKNCDAILAEDRAALTRNSHQLHGSPPAQTVIYNA